MGERDLDEVAVAVHDPVGHFAEDVPLFRGVHQADAAAGGEALAALDDLQARELRASKYPRSFIFRVWAGAGFASRRAADAAAQRVKNLRIIRESVFLFGKDNK